MTALFVSQNMRWTSVPLAPTREAVKKLNRARGCEQFPLNKGGGGIAARGVVLPVGESHDSADRMSNSRLIFP